MRRCFAARTARLIKEFSGFEALPGLKVKGANTIGENIGDLGGLNMAHEAYRALPQGASRRRCIDGLSGDQRFFLAYAQVWREKYREGALREIVMADVHSPAQLSRQRAAAEHRRVVHGLRRAARQTRCTSRPRSACGSGSD